MRRILQGIGIGVVLGAALLGLRRGVLALAIFEGTGVAPGRALWRAGAERGPELLRAALGGFALALCFALALRAGRVARVTWIVLAGVLALALTLGFPGHAAQAQLDTRSAFVVVPLALVGALALATFLATLLALARAESGPWTRTLTVLGLAVVGAAALVELGAELTTPRLVRTEIVRMLPMEGGWEIVSRHPEFPPEAGVIAPAPRPEVDGQDLPALVMPPPCELRFSVRAEDGPVRLSAAAGIDVEFVPRKHMELFPPRVLFEVRVDGELVFSEEVDPVYRGSLGPRAWRWVGGEEGLALRPGQVVTLRTELLSPKLPPERIPRIPAGFGRVRFERDVPARVERATPERPNLVLIVQDTLRADRLSCYGAEKPLSPALDALAARGLLYENAYSSSSWTWPSTASMLTGLWPETHGVTSDGSCYLPTELDTLAEILAHSGYLTAAIVGNPLILPQRNFDQGFHIFDPPPLTSFRKTSEMLPKITAFLEQHTGTRFFLYLHLVDVHYPYEPLPAARALVGGQRPQDYAEQGIVDYHESVIQRWQQRESGDVFTPVDQPVPPAHLEWLRREYDAAVATADAWLGEILAALHRLGLDERTVIAFTSDHGEELFDHGLGTHGQAVWEELVRVPLVLAGPGIPVGRVATPVSNRHLAPTLAGMAGARVPAVRSPLDLARPDALEERPIYFSTEQGWWDGEGRVVVRGVRSGPWSLQHLDSAPPSGRAFSAEGSVRLYDLARDPRQRTDLTLEEARRVEELLRTLAEHVTESGEHSTMHSLGAGAGTRAMLRAIGYTGPADDAGSGEDARARHDASSGEPEKE